MALPLITFAWDGRAMVPLPRFDNRAKEAFRVGEFYKLEAHEERSWQSHKHYFAQIHEYWLNLPEAAAMEAWGQSDEHLRKYALIKTGWCDSETFACGTKAEAQRWATNLRPIDEFSVVAARGTTVIRFTAKTQKMSAMGKVDFQKSKDDVLAFCDQLVSQRAVA